MNVLCGQVSALDDFIDLICKFNFIPLVAYSLGGGGQTETTYIVGILIVLYSGLVLSGT